MNMQTSAQPDYESAESPKAGATAAEEAATVAKEAKRASSILATSTLLVMAGIALGLSLLLVGTFVVADGTFRVVLTTMGAGVLAVLLARTLRAWAAGRSTIEWTFFYQDVYAIGLVATLLTIAELGVLFFSVFPGIRKELVQLLSTRDAGGTTLADGLSVEARLGAASIEALVGAFHLGERVTVGVTNRFIAFSALFFTTFLGALTIFSAFRAWSYEKYYRGADASLWCIGRPTLYSLLTVVLIGVFQGFACIVFGKGNPVCFSSSFMMFTRRWEYSTDYARMMYETGMCDGVDLNGATSVPVDLDADPLGALMQAVAGGRGSGSPTTPAATLTASLASAGVSLPRPLPTEGATASDPSSLAATAGGSVP